MVFQTSPGIVSREIDQSLIVSGVSTSTGAYSGTFTWGPCNLVSVISNENELIDVFHKPNDDNYVSFFSAAQFLSYSDDLRVVRVVGNLARNAAAGGDGSGLTLNTVTVNGSVTEVVINAAGADYVIGDVVLVESSLTPASVRVTDVNDTGGVTDVELLNGGSGQNNGTGKATAIVTNVLVKNKSDLTDDIYVPDVIARYPGELGNSILFSIARASEYDNWAYKSRFGLAPEADVMKFTGNAKKLAFDLPAGVTALPADSIVTVDGFKRTAGTNPGQYGVASNQITFVEATETFAGDKRTSAFTLANAYELDTRYARVFVDGTETQEYTGLGEIPVGYHTLVGNNLKTGVASEYLSGDGVTLTYTLTGIASAANARVWVDGVERDVVTTATPATGQVSVTSASGNTTLKFFTGEAPEVGNQNINIKYGYLPSTKNVEVRYGAPSGEFDSVKIFSNQTEVHAVVVDATGDWTGSKYSLLERYESLSLVPGTKEYTGEAKYYKEAINRKSRYVLVGADIKVFNDKKLTGGVDDNIIGNGVTSANLQEGYALFKNKEDITINHIICGNADLSTLQYIIGNVAEYRQDCVAYLSPQFNDVVNNVGKEHRDIVDTRTSILSSTFAHMDSCWILVYDRYNDKTRWVPANSTSAGIYAQTHDQYAPWYSGGGLNRGKFRNILKLSYVPDQTDRDILYTANVNPIAFFKSDGAVLWGDKTLSAKPSAFDRMNVRWLFITLRTRIEEVARYVAFEFNDVSTRNQFKNSVHPFLRQIQGDRGIYDFEVVCDESNNTAQIIDSNSFVCDFYIKPAKSINFIELKFTAVNRSIDFNEITSE